MNIDRAISDYERETTRRYDEQVDRDIRRAQAASIDSATTLTAFEDLLAIAKDAIDLADGAAEHIREICNPDISGDLIHRIESWTKQARIDVLGIRAQARGIDPDEPRPHGMNPAIFNGPCDCDDCQHWDAVQRSAAR